VPLTNAQHLPSTCPAPAPPALHHQHLPHTPPQSKDRDAALAALVQAAGRAAQAGEALQRVSLTKVRSRHSLLSDPAAVEAELAMPQLGREMTSINEIDSSKHGSSEAGAALEERQR
jgi:hypothetical protein